MQRFVLRVLCSLAVLACTVVATVPAARGQATPPKLYLHRMRYTTGVARAAALPAQPNAAIVQFGGPIRPADREALEGTGVTLAEYVPDFAYLVRGTADQLAAAAALPQVYAATPLLAADKLHPALLAKLAHGDTTVGSVRVFGWPNETGLAQALRAAGIDEELPLSAAALQQATALPAVRWIEPRTQPHLLDDRARAIMRVEPAWERTGLYGAGQIVGVADSGLDTGDLNTISADFRERIIATHVVSAGGDLADTIGHGTHVAGLVAGSGALSGATPAANRYNGSFAGVAPEAELVIQAFEADDKGEVVGLAADYYPLFEQAYNDGARIHTNSWGDPTGPLTDTDTENDYGGYPFGAQRTDQFVWENQDMTILFAAGNSGSDGAAGSLGICQGDGVVDPDSLLMPGTAKNVITVGASESQRPSSGLGAAPWFLLNFCFATAPLATDTLANNPNGMAAFSSRGPTDDGRTKPDIVAPGTNIVSVRSKAPGAGVLWGAYEGSEHYAYSGGTSMATPLVAGSAALVRQWLTTQGLFNPSAAAVKATLLNTTANMAPGQYGTGATQEIPLARPNSVSGWGRADLGFMATAAPYRLWVDDRDNGLATGQAARYEHGVGQPLEVLTSTQPLRVMLAWSDPPASLSAAKQLVNDLDLVVVGPNGTTYTGNNAPGGDRLNNVEGVVVQNPVPGRYRVEVRAHNVPVATQPYALAVGGPLATASEPTPSPTAVPPTTTAPVPSATTTAAPVPSITATTLPTSPGGNPTQPRVYLPLIRRP